MRLLPTSINVDSSSQIDLIRSRVETDKREFEELGDKIEFVKIELIQLYKDLLRYAQTWERHQLKSSDIIRHLSLYGYSVKREDFHEHFDSQFVDYIMKVVSS